MKTIKQIADELNIDKQKVYRFIKKNCINEALQKQGVMYYDDAAETLIIKHFSEIDASGEVLHDVHQITSNDAVIKLLQDTVEVLKNQLEEKDKQINQLTETVKQQAESINASRKNELAGTILEGHAMLSDGEEKPKGFFGWLRNKKTP